MTLSPALLALLLAASPAEPATPVSPDRAMLDSFKSACERTGDMEHMKADAVAAGWQPVADDSDPRLARLNRMGREGLEEGGKLSVASFRIDLAGRRLFLIQSRAEAAEGYWGVGCRLYHFEAGAPLDPALLTAWMGRKPTGVEDFAEGLGRRLWEPGWGPVTVNASHIPAGHPLGAAFGPQGNVLVAQAIGGF